MLSGELRIKHDAIWNAFGRGPYFLFYQEHARQCSSGSWQMTKNQASDRQPPLGQRNQRQAGLHPS